MSSAIELLLSGAAVSQLLTYLVIAWRKEVDEDRIRRTLGPPAP